MKVLNLAVATGLMVASSGFVYAKDKSVQVDIIDKPHHFVYSGNTKELKEQPCIKDIQEGNTVRYVPLGVNVHTLNVGGTKNHLYYDLNTDEVCLEVSYGMGDNNFCVMACGDLKQVDMWKEIKKKK